MAAQKARLEVIVLQHSVEQMMQKHGGSNAGPSGQTTVHSEKARWYGFRRGCDCVLFHPNKRHMSRGGCSTLHTVSSLQHSRAPPHTSPPQVWSSDTDHQLCNPPYSAARLINGLCQRQCQSIGCSFWVCLGVGEELLHSPALCSVTGKVLTLLISFFTALCQNIQLQTLKTSAIARHLQPHTAPLITVDSCTLFFFFSEGGGRDDRLCEW